MPFFSGASHLQYCAFDARRPQQVQFASSIDRACRLRARLEPGRTGVRGGQAIRKASITADCHEKRGFPCSGRITCCSETRDDGEVCRIHSRFAQWFLVAPAVAAHLHPCSWPGWLQEMVLYKSASSIKMKRTSTKKQDDVRPQQQEPNKRRSTI